MNKMCYALAVNSLIEISDMLTSLQNVGIEINYGEGIIGDKMNTIADNLYKTMISALELQNCTICISGVEVPAFYKIAKQDGCQFKVSITKDDFNIFCASLKKYEPDWIFDAFYTADNDAIQLFNSIGSATIFIKKIAN